MGKQGGVREQGINKGCGTLGIAREYLGGRRQSPIIENVEVPPAMKKERMTEVKGWSALESVFNHSL